MTTLRDIFKDPIDRAIEGVIKADDEASLRVELGEYVITNEIEKHLDNFLDAYKNYVNANGVWISGFFGCGKSHLLKILALLLENREVDGTTAYEIFKGKLKEHCPDNEILAADLERAVAIPSKSILFNIDQKADVTSKEQPDAVLSVFLKVFNEMCGFYGKQPHIAQFERDLESRGVLEKFRTAYRLVAGIPWESGREQSLLEGANVAMAYAQATGTDLAAGEDILNRYERDFKISIEDFANKVKTWIDRQQPGFRLNFFVDEVGQYIAGNVRLMTNLQTIAESLATKCQGRSFILVTAQQDIDSIIGEVDQRSANDFSKIQARFKIRLPLNSAAVAEVIQKRLLKKTDDGIELLSDLYHREAGNLRTLFDFADGSVQMRNFRDRDHFIHSYPFVPYQYELFQMAIRELSSHNAFEGKHSSVGERSMLGVFRDVAVLLADREVRRLATFDLMFEGLRSVLKSNVQASILTAERNLDNKFATRVLKALFLVKYVKGFKATVRNVAILMLDRFDTDLTAHRKHVEEALNLLEQNTYLQRSGDLFEFLTDEEKDVEQEIKQMQVDADEIAKEIEQLVFDGVLKNRRLKHEASKQDYPFARFVDDKLMGRDHELAINIVTPFHENANADAVRMHTMSKNELAVILNADSRFVGDLLTLKKTEKYVRQAQTEAVSSGRARIINEKREQATSRLRDLTLKAKALLIEARLFARGAELEIRSENAQTRIEGAFQTLVDKVYTNLGMLRGFAYSENEIGKFLTQGGDGPGADTSVTEAEQEILNYAQANTRTGMRTTVKAVIDRFDRSPYGWSYAAILCTVASLLGRGKVEARLNGAPLEGDALLRGLRNSHEVGNIVLELQAEFTQGQMSKLKSFYSEFFNLPPAASSDAKALGIETGAAFAKVKEEIAGLEAQVSRYPFLTVLSPVREAVATTAGKSYAWYLTDLGQQADHLLDLKEGVLDKVRSFMNGPQKAIYDDARSWLDQQSANLEDVGDDKAADIRAVLADPNCFKGNAIQQMKAKLDALKAEVNERVAAERAAALAEVDEVRDKLRALPEYAALTGSGRQAIETDLAGVRGAIDTSSLIAVIRNRVNGFKTSTYPTLLDRVTAAAAPGGHEQPGGFSNGGQEPFTPPPTMYVAASTLRVAYDKAFLADERDVDAYITSLRTMLMAEIQAGKRITV